MSIIYKETIPEREKITEEKMKKKTREQKIEPVPVRRRLIYIIAGIMLMSGAIASGLCFAPEIVEAGKIPVVLSNGNVIMPPYYITVDGKKTLLVKSEETAGKAIEKIVNKYQRETSSSSILTDIEIKEKIAVEPADIRNGDEPPDILTSSEAAMELEEDEDGEASITVVTTEEKTEEEEIAFEQEYRAEDSLYAGETKIATAGRPGEKEITKKVIKENGKTVDEKIINEEIISEPQEEVILTGTKVPYGYGGGENAGVDEGVSYDENAAYDVLKTPVDTVYLSSGFGTRWGRLHRGIDLALPEGSPIYAADSGTVYFSGNGGGYGNMLKLDHGNGMQTYYAHCSRLIASEGQQVNRGELIALVGSTGNSTGPHLHFEVIINGSCTDPQSLLEL